ncbi:MAG: hypothetical protein IJV36_06960 [Prevotella sp.]|nr:hypothetical protein [Prevotella sp.]
MKKKYLEPRCKHILLAGLQVMAGSLKIGEETVEDGGWAKEIDTDGENTVSSHSVWED